VTLSTPSPNTGSYDPATGPVVEAVRKVEPAVVNVTTNVVQQDQFGAAQVGKGVGTGFLVRQDGILITNYHVVEGGLQIRVRFNDTAPKASVARCSARSDRRRRDIAGSSCKASRSTSRCRFPWVTRPRSWSASA
jgi:hypothetical protein